MFTLPTEMAQPVADFSQDTWWIWLIKAVFIVLFLILSVILALWVERRGLGRMQTRLGPNVTGFMGFGQAFADAIKLMIKEDFWLKGADRVIYFLAPVIAATCAFSIFAVMPFGPQVSMFGIETPLQLTDSSVAMLYVLAIAALGVYGLVLGGWAANSTYPLLGSVRSAAQVISYELGMGISLASVFLIAGTMSTSSLVDSQTSLWHVFIALPAFITYFISMVGEVNRLPFDLPEAEGELVAGHTTEYSSMKFAWFYLSEYINMINVSAVATVVFLGGWRAPWPLSAINDGMFNEGWWPMLWFIAKVWFFMFLMVWIRGTLLRMRYDHFMKLGWKVLIPVALGWLVAVAVIQGIGSFTDIDTQTILVILAAIFLVIFAVLWFVDGKKGDDGSSAPEEQPEFDAFAGGFPVPPMPGQTLPPSPRAKRAPAYSSTAKEAGSDE
ncbi:NADH-quinone oxidoreductase subunit NuoH [Flaviflexus salsibiostraticola]|uniref:NADH-quinone oxidoreductase subunit H n=1 Tax=Flaviflexus salsibiostraticola TaxID=1282737 RepID=A0A3Q8WTS7_9ACTO|nr:NADH-quinone oxidoreductase subunit NuoH [Flaviflexus salsibiostraticola]AZN29943.1 NADH-quinone oxidoreductase subunit NuoH [Flaviflexus salsibiostraticola]